MKTVTSTQRQLLDDGIIVYSRAIVYFQNEDGTGAGSLTLTPENFRVSGNSFSQSAGASGFPLGAVLCKSIVLTISNQHDEYGDYNWERSHVRLFSDIYPSGISGSNQNLSREGDFYTSTVRYVQNAIEITAYDMISLLNTPFYINNRNAGTGVKLYDTVWDYFVYLCNTVLRNRVGDLGTGDMYARHLNTDRFMNSTFSLNAIEPDMSAKTTLRDVFGYIAQLAGGNIVVTYDSIGARDVIDIIPYSLEHTEYTIYTGMLFGETVTNTFDGGEFGETVTDVLQGGEVQNSTRVITLDHYQTTPTMEYKDVKLTGVSVSYPVVNSNNNTASTSSSSDNVLSLENPLLEIGENTAENRARVQACVDNIYDAVCEKPIRPFEGTFYNNPLIEFMDNIIVVDGWGNAHNSFVTEHTYNYLGTSQIANRVPTIAQNKNVFFR